MMLEVLCLVQHLQSPAFGHTRFAKSPKIKKQNDPINKLEFEETDMKLIQFLLRLLLKYYMNKSTRMKVSQRQQAELSFSNFLC
jgi:hypothetical protein